jgi:hypothetical protein
MSQFEQFNWGQININLVNQLGQRLRGADNNWGQININLVNQRGQSLRGLNKWGQININLLGAQTPLNHKKLMLI